MGVRKSIQLSVMREQYGITDEMINEAVEDLLQQESTLRVQISCGLG